ncbi:hypothetical protein ACFVVA_28090 [Kitasatospora sp. NPDC058048]|uniref:hypothetical protein n=1 Tax=Kitasatospora sp. NPDC058048 TaxID=3346313 RepID=UPI0036D7AEE2
MVKEMTGAEVAVALRGCRGSQQQDRHGRRSRTAEWRSPSGAGEDRNQSIGRKMGKGIRWRSFSRTAEDRNAVIARKP